MAYIPHPSTGITAPPAHDPVTGGMILAAMAVVVVILAGIGVVLGIRRIRRGLGAFPGVARHDPRSGDMQDGKVAAALYKASPCGYCHAREGDPCTWKYEPGEHAVVLGYGLICHYPRIESGCRGNLKLYLKLLASWQGPLPGVLEGLHDIGDTHH